MIFSFFPWNNKKYFIFDQNDLVEYQFDVVDFNPRILRDIRNDLEVVECRKMKKSAKKCKNLFIKW